MRLLRGGQVLLTANYRIPAHFHPNDEQLTVLSGTFYVGMGDQLDESKAQEVPAGGFANVPLKTASPATASPLCPASFNGTLTVVEPFRSVAAAEAMPLPSRRST